MGIVFKVGRTVRELAGSAVFQQELRFVAKRFLGVVCLENVSSVLTKAKDDTHDALAVQPPSSVLLALDPLVEDIAVLVLVRMERKRSAHHRSGHGHVKRMPCPASIAGPIMGSSARQHERLWAIRFKLEKHWDTLDSHNGGRTGVL